MTDNEQAIVAMGFSLQEAQRALKASCHVLLAAIDMILNNDPQVFHDGDRDPSTETNRLSEHGILDDDDDDDDDDDNSENGWSGQNVHLIGQTSDDSQSW